ncbi:hypothetical protein IWW45_008360 [Coemansia sp. RSA 485]|nr:hypothetical protein IWW45_008360 [Coemansia sp. RSA 485]KAJ2601610.1 hypothetical protein GGF39_001174 [Coemansia sp. RSA 1721]
MNLGNAPPPDPPNQQHQQQEALPSYEETIETQFQKRYTLRYPQVFTRTVHAIDTDTRRLAYVKKARGFNTGSRSQYYNDMERLLWCCSRERNGLELVFSREAVSDNTDVLDDSGQQVEEREEYVGIDDVIGTTEALLDNKGEGIVITEYVNLSHINEDGPPAYQESEGSSGHDGYQVRLISVAPFPFIYDFEFPGSSQDGRLRWIRNHQEEEKSQNGQQHAWTAFSCIERTTGRTLAEIVLKSQRDSGLGTLVIHGDLDPDMHEFLVVSAIAVVEEYPVRQVEFLNQT